MKPLFRPTWLTPCRDDDGGYHQDHGNARRRPKYGIPLATPFLGVIAALFRWRRRRQLGWLIMLCNLVD